MSTHGTEHPNLAIPDCIAVDARGYGWRVWADEENWSMVPTTEDNLPIPEPITWFARSQHGPPLAAQIRFLTRERDELKTTLARIVANESNHYDRYWEPAPEPLTDEYLDATEAKMREALEDVFCDDAAAVMLTLIAEIRRLRRGN